MTFHSSALAELVMSSPGQSGLVAALDTDGLPEIVFTLDDQAIAVRAIAAGIAEAEAAGTRAAVCVVDLTAVNGYTPEGSKYLDAADAWIVRRLRGSDRLYHVGGTFVVVAPGINHPHEGELLVERLRALPSSDGPPSVGLAIYPTHAEEPEALFDRAWTSARRAAYRRRASDRVAPARETPEARRRATDRLGYVA